MRRPNSTSTTYGYDAVSRLTSLAHDVPNNTYDLTLTEGYNPAFQIVTETRSNDTYSFTANANTNINYTANGLNQGKQADATVYGFDTNGNLTSDGWFTFTYDLENKLLSALPINAGIRTLSYDPLNRLDVYNPGTAKRFIYDGAEVVAELDSSGTIIGRYVRGDAPDEIITGYTSSSATARGWYHLDQRNSVIAVTDPNGVVTVVNRYDEYGQPQGGNYGTFQYTGQMWLGEIGIYNYKNRMYWPNERPGGRFLQPDPVGPVDSANLYQYALNDPVNNVDPLGLAQWCQVYDSPWGPCPMRGGEPTSTGGTGNVPGTNERGGGGGGGTPIEIVAPHVRQAVKDLSKMACHFGNTLESFSEGAGRFAVATAAQGGVAVVVGWAGRNPVLLSFGGGSLAVGAAAGNLAGLAQFVGGLYQGASGHGFGNSVKAAGSFGLSAVLSSVFRMSIPRAFRNESALTSERRLGGNVLAALQQSANALAPTQVICN